MSNVKDFQSTLLQKLSPETETIVFPIRNQGKEILKTQQMKLFSIDICLTL